MRSIDTYLCKQPKKEFSFIFMGVDYFVRDALGPVTRQRIKLAISNGRVSDLSKSIKLTRFADTGIVDCVL